MGNRLHKYRWGEYNNVFGMGAGGQNSWADIYLKLEFPVLFIPVLSSVSFRQIPWDSVDFRRLSTTISTYCRAQTKMYVGGGPGPKVPLPIFT